MTESHTSDKIRTDMYSRCGNRGRALFGKTILNKFYNSSNPERQYLPNPHRIKSVTCKWTFTEMLYKFYLDIPLLGFWPAFTQLLGKI